MRECMTATRSPKRPRKRATVCGVSDISGTSTHAVRPAASVSSMACRYTSVLPEPVTPSTSTTSPSPRERAASMAASASACPRVSGGFDEGVKEPAGWTAPAGWRLAGWTAAGWRSESASVSAALEPGSMAETWRTSVREPSSTAVYRTLREAAASTRSVGRQADGTWKPRMRRRCSMRTTPCFSSALRGDDTAPNSAVSSATRSSPRSSAAAMDACFTAFLRGSKSASAGPGTTQRSSTSPTVGSSRRQ